MKKLEQKDPPCVCEEPGHFRSGVAGILAHVEDGRIMRHVERCDTCRRFRDDQVAEAVLRRILKANRSPHRGRTKNIRPRRRL